LRKDFAKKHFTFRFSMTSPWKGNH